MPLSKINYSERVAESGLRVYTVAEADGEGCIRTEQPIPNNPSFNTYSIAKAFSVLAVGICRDRGLLDVTDKLPKLLGKYMTEDENKKWEKVTLHDIMRHRAGFGSGLLDIDAEDPNEWKTQNYLSIVLKAPLVFAPGEKCQYTDAAYYLVSRVVSEATGKSLADFLRPTLFGIMKFSEFAADSCPQGYTIGATGFYMRTKDMIKLGILWLRNGDWFGNRIVSEEWIRLTEKYGYEFSPKSENTAWIGKDGMRGQMLAYNRTLDRVIAWNGYDSVPFEAIVKE